MKADATNTVIFLDFDGALFPRRFSILSNGADPVLVMLLNNFGQNGAKIVACSSARNTEGAKIFVPTPCVRLASTVCTCMKKSSQIPLCLAGTRFGIFSTSIHSSRT